MQVTKRASSVCALSNFFWAPGKEAIKERGLCTQVQIAWFGAALSLTMVIRQSKCNFQQQFKICIGWDHLGGFIDTSHR